jgi:predicted ribosomally synthesized peptide with nif11-like leader
MKTLEDFIQRLQDDPAFEKQAQAFDQGHELIAFVKREGYDFTLEQLMREFERGEKLTAETGGMAPAPAEVSPSPPPRPVELEFPRPPEFVSSPERYRSLLETGNDDVTQEPPVERLPPPEAAMPPPADVSPAPPPRPVEPEFPRPPEFVSSPGRGMDLPKRGIDDFTREPPLKRVAHSKEAMPPPEPEAEPRAGLFKGGGGRHRGCCLQRLKPVSGEEP